MNITTLLLIATSTFKYHPKNDKVFKLSETTVIENVINENTVTSMVYNVYVQDYTVIFGIRMPKEYIFEYVFPYKDSVVYVLKSLIDNATLFHFISEQQIIHSYIPYKLIRYDNLKKEIYFYHKRCMKIFPILNFIISTTKDLPHVPTETFCTRDLWEDFHFLDKSIIYKTKNSTFVHPQIHLSADYNLYFYHVNSNYISYKKVVCFLLSFVILLFTMFGV